MSKSDIFFHLMKNNQWDDFEDFAAFNYFNRGYSVFNSALILLQKPGATSKDRKPLESRETLYQT